MQKISMVTFDPFASDRPTLGFFSKAWRRTSRKLFKGSMIDEIEYDLKRLEARMGLYALSQRKIESTAE